MNNPLRQFWFRHYWWIVAALLGVTIGVIQQTGIKDGLGLIATLTGVALTVVYFVQKQKLEEVQLFERLFTDFNRRYAELNDRLEDIKAGRIESEVEAGKVLTDYFNLCAEEYLFYSEGRIHPAAWQAWCRGMLYHLKNERIRQHCQGELKSESHYGLTLEIIDRGAA